MIIFAACADGGVCAWLFLNTLSRLLAALPARRLRTCASHLSLL